MNIASFSTEELQEIIENALKENDEALIKMASDEIETRAEEEVGWDFCSAI